jgi:hypothetical protein
MLLRLFVLNGKSLLPSLIMAYQNKSFAEYIRVFYRIERSLHNFSKVKSFNGCVVAYQFSKQEQAPKMRI